MNSKLLIIINFIREGKGDAPHTTLKSNVNLRDDLGFSSFDLAELTVRIEDEFDIDIFEDGLISTVGEILERLDR